MHNTDENNNDIMIPKVKVTTPVTPEKNHQYVLYEHNQPVQEILHILLLHLTFRGCGLHWSSAFLMIRLQ